MLLGTIKSLKKLTLRRPKEHGSQAPDVPDLAQTVKPWSGLSKIFKVSNEKVKCRAFVN